MDSIKKTNSSNLRSTLISSKTYTTLESKYQLKPFNNGFNLKSNTINLLCTNTLIKKLKISDDFNSENSKKLLRKLDKALEPIPMEDGELSDKSSDDEYLSEIEIHKGEESEHTVRSLVNFITSKS